MAKLSPVFIEAQLINGIPANGAKVFTYVAGSTTKQTTYTDEDGLTPQSNPIILDSRGEPSQPIWLTAGNSYKFVFAPADDTDPPTSPIRTIDDVTGINDATIALSQWVDLGISPTYISNVSFSLPGDQTSQYQVKRRIKATVTAGTVYGYISASAYTSLTTVTVVLDSGDLDSGLTKVELGLITPIDTSMYKMGSGDIENLSITNAKLAEQYINDLTEVTFDQFTDFVPIADGSDSGKKKKAKITITDKIQPITASVGGNALTLTLNPTILDFRDATLGSGTVNTRVISIPISLVISSGSTLGTLNATLARIALVAIDNAGTVELAAINTVFGVNFNDSDVITTVAEGGAGAADTAGVYYSNTARTNVPYRVVGYIESTQATAGTWVTAPSKIQGSSRIADLRLFLNMYGNTPAYATKAWIKFNGSGTIAINASGNILSVTDNGTGDYILNFAIPFQDANYAFSGACDNLGSNSNGIMARTAVPPTASTLRLNVRNFSTGAETDASLITVTVVR